MSTVALRFIFYVLFGSIVTRDVLVWWLTAQAFGLAGLPLTRFLFRALPDRGYAFGKALGLLLSGYLAWLLAMLGLAPFGRVGGAQVVPVAVVARVLPAIPQRDGHAGGGRAETPGAGLLVRPELACHVHSENAVNTKFAEHLFHDVRA